MRKIWAKGTIPPSWKLAEGCFVPKEERSSTISQFRTISLLSVECKIFFSILARRITTYMTQNQYINTSIQKGGIPGFSGCLEHTSMITQLIQEARQKKSDLTVIWLDLANAYGSIPHSLIQEGLDHYHIPVSIRGMITNYLAGFRLRFTSALFTTSWLDLQKGIPTGCTISPILFIMGMNLLLSAAEGITRGPKLESGVVQPVLRAFMDDITLTTVTHVQARWVLETLGSVASWAGMLFKARKSRSMVIKKGRVTSKFSLKVQDELIPSIEGNPVKCLGKWFNASLTDGANVAEAVKQTEEWLKKIDKSLLPGKFKTWLYQHGLLPRLLWLFTVYEFPMTTIEVMERKTNKHLRKWLGIPPSFSSVGLYIRSGQLQLPLSSVVEEYKVAKCRVLLSLRDSNDDLIKQSGITTRSGRKWAANTAVEQAVSSLKLRDIVGNQCVHRQGLGSAQFQTWGGANVRTRRGMVQAEVRSREEEKRLTRAVQQGSQGAWTKWDLPRRKITWGELWRLEPYRISFLLRSVYDTLPSPAHLHTWGLREDPLCKLCGQKGTLAHILSGCKTSLTQGRYRWRHDKVLLSLADTIERERVKKRPAPTTAERAITFLKEGARPVQTARGKRPSILNAASSWEMRVDLGRRLQFPEVVVTSLRPDIVLWSTKDQKIVLVELTVPWEEGCEVAHERKAAKYQELAQECRERGWQTWVFPVEIGCRGFPAKSTWKFLSAIGMDERSKKQAARRMGEAAERASCWIWSKREEESWKPGADGQ